MAIRFWSVLLFLLGHACHAAGYPEKTIRIVTPYPAGGVTDIVARPIAAKLANAWSVSVIVDNRPGAGGNIAADLVAKSPPDGYTLLISSTAPNAVNASLFPKMPYDTLTAFAPITQNSRAYLMFVIHPSLPVATVKEFIALGKSKPAKDYTYGSSGNGSTPHLAGELFSSLTGVKMTHVPYKAGGLQYALDLMTGRTDLAFASVLHAAPHIRTGKMKLLAITAKERDRKLPDTPTVSETISGYEVGSWYGVVAPAKTPAPIIEKLHGELLKILSSPDIRTVYEAAGLEPYWNTPAEYTAYIREEHDKWAKIIKQAKIRLD